MTRRVESVLSDELKPAALGLLFYYSYRSRSEQATLKEPAWSRAMSLAKDLLEQAKHLASRERKRPKQASLRRAVSTAYYAVFYLLIGEAVRNWSRSDQRAKLARAFEHG